MRNVALAALAAVALLGGGCGHGRHDADDRQVVPDVRGLSITNAVQRLFDARLCVRLELARTLHAQTVGRESPLPGTRLAAWRPVVVAVGLPAGAKAAGVDVVVFGKRKTPCPPIAARG